MKKFEIQVETRRKTQIVDITDKVRAIARGRGGAACGALMVFCPHTTAGVTINESADPDVKRDYLYALEHIVDCEAGFKHAEGNSKAHVSAAVTGASLWVGVEDGHLCLGTWQSLWFCEFDGPRKRTVWVFAAAAAGGAAAGAADEKSGGTEKSGPSHEEA